MPYPCTPRAILVSFVATILGIRRRTLLPPRIRQEPDEAPGTRADLAWTGKGLCNVAPQQGVILTLTSLSLALRSGDAFRIARGLSFAGCGFTPGLVGPGKRYLRWLQEMAESLDDNRLRVLHRGALGGRSLMTGDWAHCVSACQEAVSIAEVTPAPTHWEQTIARTFESAAYEFMGHFRQMASSSGACLRVVRGRGDRIGEVMIGSGLGYALAAHHDRPALTEVIEEMKRLMGEWTVPVPFWEAFLLRLECLRALCWGETQESLALLDARWSTLREHRLLDLPMVRYPLTSVRASVLLEATARGLVSRERSVPSVRRCISVLSRAPRAEGPAAAEIARAALAHLEGRAARRDVHLRRAIDIARAGRMRAVELMASRALAAHRSAAPDITRIDTELLSLGVGSPVAWARAVTPALGAA